MRLPAPIPALAPTLTLALTLALGACAAPGEYVGSPFDGAGGFLSDTLVTRTAPNRPPIASENMRRVQGEAAALPPLLPEPGNVWPPPPTPDPTLADLERQQSGQPLPGQPQPGQSQPGQSQSGQPAPQSAAQPLGQSPGLPREQPAPTGTVQTSQGPAIIRNDANGQQSYTLPNGQHGRAINNGNGTITLIGNDGSVQSVPAPR
ncbi:MAG: hypothetical protein KGL55_00345 [Rhodospirillales bacterium]|nr:hypothetical protein [Rhodospirillales bacterium]